MKKFSAILILAVLIFTAAEGLALQSSPTQAVGKQPVKSVAKKKLPKKYKVRKYVSPPINELRVDDIPLALPIPPEVTEALAAGDIEGAIRILRIEPPSLRALNLLREAQRIETFKKHKKISKIDAHKSYQNLGVAYHNLYLYLKRNGRDNPDFVKSALKYYKKAGKSLSISEQTESKVLEAALLAASGKNPEAEKIFSKLDINLLDDKDSRLAYVAGYYAAIGNNAAAIEKLRAAYDLGGEHIGLWVRISDDFYMLENDESFHAMLDDWAKRDKLAKLEREKSARDGDEPVKKKKAKKKKTTPVQPKAQPKQIKK